MDDCSVRFALLPAYERKEMGDPHRIAQPMAQPSPFRHFESFSFRRRIVLELVLDFLFFQGTQAGSAIPPEPESPVSSQIFVVAP